MLPKAQRLTKRLFSESFSHSKIASNDYFTLRYKDILENSSKISKVSIVISKKVCQKAVDRNKLKRKLYEVAQKNLENLKKPYVLMVFPKKISTTLSFFDLEKELKEVLVGSKILKQ